MSLPALPTELLLLITSHLTPNDIYHLILTSRTLFTVLHHHLLLFQNSNFSLSEVSLDYGQKCPYSANHARIIPIPIIPLELRVRSRGVCNDPIIWAAIWARLYLLHFVSFPHSLPFCRRRGIVVETRPEWQLPRLAALSQQQKFIVATQILLREGKDAREKRLKQRHFFFPELQWHGPFRPAWDSWVYDRAFDGRLDEIEDGDKVVNRRASNGMTALVLAAVVGDANAVRSLMNKGADPRLKVQGRTAYQWADWMGNDEVMKVLETWSWRWKNEFRQKGGEEMERMDTAWVARTDYYSLKNRWRRLKLKD